MVSLDVHFKILAAIVSVSFGALVISGGPRRPANVALGIFLLLIAGNHAAEAMQGSVTDPATRLAWRRAATVLAALDPFALYYFASVYPTRNDLNRPSRVALVGAFAGALAVWGGWAYIDPSPPRLIPWVHYVFPLVLSAFTILIYGIVLRWALDRLSTSGSADWRLFVMAASVAAFAPAATLGARLIPTAFFLDGTYTLGPPIAYLVHLLSALAVFGLAAWILRGRDAQAWKASMVGIALALVFTLVEATGVFWTVTRGLTPPAITVFGQASTSIRWLLFGGLISGAILTHNAFGMTMRNRRRAARMLIGLSIVAVGGLAAAAIAGSSGVPWWAFVAIGSAVLFSQAFRGLVDLVAWRVYGVPRPSDPEARFEAYRLGVSQALAEGRSVEDPKLDELLDELGLGADVAAVIAHSVEARGGPIVQGQVVARRYRVVRALGQGAGGRVFLARDERLGRDVVLKEVFANASGAEEVALREAQLAGQIGHANVVTVFDVIQRGVGWVLVTEYVAGGSLAARLKESGKLAPIEGCDLLRGIVEGTAAIHAKGVIHRDLKPSNVLLALDGTPKVADFGLARLGEEASTRGAEKWGVSGTPAFMAPEQRRGEPATMRTDVYALGLLATTCIQAPLPPRVGAVVARALDEDPSKRWADARKMSAALQAAIRQAQ